MLPLSDEAVVFFSPPNKSAAGWDRVEALLGFLKFRVRAKYPLKRDIPIHFPPPTLSASVHILYRAAKETREFETF